jgi:hypothetical protein
MNECGVFVKNNSLKVNDFIDLIIFLNRFLDATEIQTIRDRIGGYPPVIYPEPPYQVATNSRLKVKEKLQQIQNYIQRLEYNYTGMQFFDINPARPLCGLMDSARHM